MEESPGLLVCSIYGRFTNMCPKNQRVLQVNKAAPWSIWVSDSEIAQVSSVQNPSLIQSKTGWLRTGFPVLGLLQSRLYMEGSIIHYNHQPTGVLNTAQVKQYRGTKSVPLAAAHCGFNRQDLRFHILRGELRGGHLWVVPTVVGTKIMV